MKRTLPNGTVLNFPDGMSEEQINEATRQYFKQFGDNAASGNSLSKEKGPTFLGHPLFKENLNDEQFKQRTLKPLQAAGAGAADALLDVGSGINRGLTSAINAPLRAVGLPGFQAAGKPYEFSKMEKGHPLATMIGSMAPYLLAPEVRVAEGAGFLPGLANTAATGAGYSGLASAGNLQSTPKDIAKNAGIGALIGAGTHGASHGVDVLKKIPSSAINFMAKYLQKGSELSSEELAQKLKVAQDAGIKVNAADLLGGATSARYHDYLGNLPFSGIAKDEAKMLRGIKEHGNNFVKKLQGDVEDEDMFNYLKDSIKDNFNAINEKKQRNYKLRDEMSEQAGIRPDNSETYNAHANILKSLEDTPESEKVDLPDDLQKELEKLNKSKSDKRLPTMEQATQKLSEYRQKYREAEENKDANLMRLWGKLKNAKQKDIDNAIKNSGYTSLKNLSRDADLFYKEHYVPYKENADIRKILNDKINEKSLSGTLLNSKNAKVLEHLSPEDKNKVLYSYLRPAINKDGVNLNVNPNSIFKKFESLGGDQRARLVTPEVENEVNNLKTLGSLSTESKLSQRPPATGYRTTKDLFKIASLLGLGYGIPHAMGSDSGLTNDLLIALLAGGRLGRKVANSKTLLKAITGGGREPIMNINVPSKQAKGLQLAKILGGAYGANQ